MVANKTDLPVHADFADSIGTFGDDRLIRLSAKTRDGVDELTETIFKMMTGGGVEWDPGSAAVPNLRQKDALGKALAACSRVTSGLQTDLPPDLIAIELQTALDHLGDIIGETTGEDILDMIFARFCIGK